MNEIKEFFIKDGSKEIRLKGFSTDELKKTMTLLDSADIINKDSKETQIGVELKE